MFPAKLTGVKVKDSEGEKSPSFSEYKFILDNDKYPLENFGLFKNGNN